MALKFLLAIIVVFLEHQYSIESLHSIWSKYFINDILCHLQYYIKNETIIN
jgi:hypothetical protein